MVAGAALSDTRLVAGPAKTTGAHPEDTALLSVRLRREQRGDVIAYLGNSGRSTAPHLHYEVRVNDIAQNPLNYILPSDVIVD